jgi:outer membrane protein assembly factor BamB
MRTLLCLFIFVTAVLSSCRNSPGENDQQPAAFTTSNALFESMQVNRQWPSYRGYLACGYLDNTQLPDSFNIGTGYNVRWNIEVPGMGLSCPSIWDDNIFITSAISETDDTGFETGIFGDVMPVSDTSVHVWMLYCLNKNNGKVRWEREMHRGVPAVKRHPKSTHANTTVATDGKHVVVFLGSEGLYCYDMEGTLFWKRDFGVIMSAWDVMESAEWEFASSPVIFGDRVVIQADALNQAFVAVLDLETGETVWKKERDEISTWCTPSIYIREGRPAVVVNGFKHRGGYDLETGEEIWSMSGGGDIPVPVPVVWKDLIFFNSAHGKQAPLMAVRSSAAGKISYPKEGDEQGEHVAWFYEREGSYMSSVLVYDSLLYRFRWNGNLSCYDARTGEKIYSENVKTYSFIASPVASDGKIYLVAETGEVYIVKAGKAYALLQTIPLGDISLVTPGIAEDMLVFRTARRLIAVGK